jgi:hypothetical protein
MYNRFVYSVLILFYSDEASKVMRGEGKGKQNITPVPGSLNTKEGRKFHLILSKRWHLLLPFLYNEPGTAISKHKPNWSNRGGWVMGDGYKKK